MDKSFRQRTMVDFSYNSLLNVGNEGKSALYKEGQNGPCPSTSFPPCLYSHETLYPCPIVGMMLHFYFLF